MGGLIFLVLVGIIILGLWLYRKALSGRPADDQPPLIRIPCQDGYIIGYYQGNRLIGQRFVNNRLASEGVFVNGLQVGSGKEYYQGGRLKYEGNFSNGLASGLGKLYEENGRLKYIGNFTNGYAAGQGRIFDQNGKLKYEGQFARLPVIRNKPRILQRHRDPAGNIMTMASLNIRANLSMASGMATVVPMTAKAG